MDGASPDAPIGSPHARQPPSVLIGSEPWISVAPSANSFSWSPSAHRPGVRRPAADDIEESRGRLVIARHEQLDAAIGLILHPPRQPERPRPFAHELPKADALNTPDDAHVMDGHVRNLATDAEQCP